MNWISVVRSELKALDTSRVQLRRFGLIVGILFVAISLVFRKGYAALPMGFAIVGVFLAAGALIRPRVLSGPHRFWMGFALIVGWIIQRVILTILFYVVLTPIALFARLVGKEFMDIDWVRKKDSYWISREDKHTIDYRKMY